MKTTGGYNSWLNGKIERPHQTLMNMVNSSLRDSGHNTDNGSMHEKLRKKYIIAYYIQLLMNNLHTYGIGNVQTSMILEYGYVKYF